MILPNIDRDLKRLAGLAIAGTMLSGAAHSVIVYWMMPGLPRLMVGASVKATVLALTAIVFWRASVGHSGHWARSGVVAMLVAAMRSDSWLDDLGVRGEFEAHLALDAVPTLIALVAFTALQSLAAASNADGGTT